MKNAVKISIKKPCSENFSNFSTTASGGFCGSCQEEVIDFTSMSPEEILEHFKSTSTNSCGRFKASQLTTYAPMMKHTTQTNLVSRGMAILGFSLLSLCAVSQVQAQDVANDQSVKTEVGSTYQNTVMGRMAVQSYTVKGRVLDEDNLPLAGVNVILKGSTEGVQTDFDGKFEFPRPLNVDDTLVFSYIGYEKKEYTITSAESNTLDITINFDASDIFLMGEVTVDGIYESKPNIFQKFISIFN
ncbi:carboxypeptidase-like regulatory domain-containing protein [Maribacter chungangensis]|uniref:Carboxypeptidase-like regulatory domain-containing protein n=1 Tax=Maribacter chungangensis TaxID=1069117 RepID=A0ABW3B041_9FLAO